MNTNFTENFAFKSPLLGGYEYAYRGVFFACGDGKEVLHKLLRCTERVKHDYLVPGRHLLK